MLASMTGFGRAILDAPFGRLVAEIQSVNRKYLEVFVSLPKEFGRFEQEIRMWVGEKIARGQVSVRIHVIPSADAAIEQLPDPKALKVLKREWEKIAKSLGYDPKKIDLPFLMQYCPIQQKSGLAEDKDLPFIEKCMKEAMDGLCKMKIKEGKALLLDVAKRIGSLKKNLKSIESLAPEASARMKKNLGDKMKDLKASPELDERLLREMLLFADRVDITEEITRLRSHFNQFEGMLDAKEKTIGRKMDFLIQEMGREINTIGSKSLDAKISHYVVEMKSELEKIREQIQNIE
jgi:uncharacterized protein (TIGR00255 family)